jgi:hypothetical protein
MHMYNKVANSPYSGIKNETIEKAAEARLDSLLHTDSYRRGDILKFLKEKNIPTYKDGDKIKVGTPK